MVKCHGIALVHRIPPVRLNSRTEKGNREMKALLGESKAVAAARASASPSVLRRALSAVQDGEDNQAVASHMVGNDIGGVCDD